MGDHTTYFFKVRSIYNAFIFLLPFSDSSWQLSYMPIHFLQATKALFVKTISIGNGQGCSAHFTICHSASQTQHHNITSFLQISAECPSFILRKTDTKSINTWGKTLSFLNNTCMRNWASQSGKENRNNRAEMLDHNKSLWLPFKIMSVLWNKHNILRQSHNQRIPLGSFCWSKRTVLQPKYTGSFADKAERILGFLAKQWTMQGQEGTNEISVGNELISEQAYAVFLSWHSSSTNPRSVTKMQAEKGDRRIPGMH